MDRFWNRVWPRRLPLLALGEAWQGFVRMKFPDFLLAAGSQVKQYWLAIEAIEAIEAFTDLKEDLAMVTATKAHW